MATSSSVPIDMSQCMDDMMMYVTAPTAAMREGRYAVSRSIILKHKSDAWMSLKLKDAIRKGQSISLCLFDDHTSVPVTNNATEQPANGHAFCIRDCTETQSCRASAPSQVPPKCHTSVP